MLAFDFGLRRIGVAIGETYLCSARPLTTIEAEANAQRFSAIDRLIGEWRPARLVVGLPAHVDRETPHEFAARCERFARQLAGRYRLPVEFVDERYSSWEAETQRRVGKRKTHLDAEAAAIILQTWFDQRPTHPTPAPLDAPAATT
ncbi:MAG: Holliday junction resolvase RuvX [Rhodocyclaceae bacterium]